MRICKRIGLGALLLALAAAGVLAYAHWVEPRLLTVRTLSVETTTPIRPCRVVFFTDTHFGALYGGENAGAIADKINALDADLVVFGGDLFDNYARDKASLDLDALRRELGRIQAKAGKFAVWGNHDYGGGAARIYADFLASCGFEVLNDESRALPGYGISIIGYDDALLGYTDPSLYTVQNEGFSLVAAHEPVIAQRLDGAGEQFVLTGHTHGGQVWLPFLTARILPPGAGAFVKGLYTAEDLGTDRPVQMYTSSGIGMTKYPLRLGNPPEIVAIDFTGPDT